VWSALTIKDRIRELRNELGLSQVKFAKGISVSSGYIARLETGNLEVHERIIRLICITYNVSELWLREGTGDKFVGQSGSTTILALSYFEQLTPNFKDYVLRQLENLLLLLKQEQEKERH